MPTDHRTELAKIRTFPSLVRYLRDEMDWPIQADDFDELTFEYSPEELGIDSANAAKIQEIKRLRPLSAGQPWGIFFVKFEPKKLPVVALRRILSQVALKKRASANSAERAAWVADDLLFISNYGEGDERQISFAHFSKAHDGRDLPTLKVLGWDNRDTALHLDAVAKGLTEHLAWPDEEADVDAWRQRWRAAFILRYGEVVTTSKELSIRLAKLARDIRDLINAALTIETESGPLTKLMKAFKAALVHDLDADGFADMYAQTIAYGLLSARIADPEKKTADDFAGHMRTNPFLRELMETFLKVGGRRGKAGGPGIDFDELGVSEVVQLLDDANMEAVVRDFDDRNPQEDPVVHFYELFLKEYDPKMRLQRGVFYTPRPVVSYIVRSVDELLRTEFGLEDGLADTATWGEMATRHMDLKIPEGVPASQAFVQILDPATGTGTFLVEVIVIDLIYKTLVEKWKAQGHGEKKIDALWNEHVPKHLLPCLHGYELMMAPYAIAHLKIGLKLYETGYRFGSQERARIYLTNALEPPLDFSDRFIFDVPALAHEAQAVNRIKRHQRFTVFIGNPPYARISSNMGAWISKLIEDFKYVDGVHFAEVKHWLHDDYVKFIRLGYLAIENAGFGTLGMISNRGYLSGPTFRGMRSFIWQNSSTLHLMDLHGGALQEECKPPPGVTDENVFDIKQGVAIIVAARAFKPASISARSYSELWGDRNTKYGLLVKRSSLSEAGIRLTAVSPRYDFIPNSNVELDREYSEFAAVNEIFLVGSTGIQTSRDSYVVDYDKSTLQKRFQEFCDNKLPDKFFRMHYGLEDGRNWCLPDARRMLRADPKWNLKIVRCQFRPLDIRWMLYHSSVINWPRPEVMPHMLRNNIALVIPRNYQGGQFDAALVSRFITEVKTGESTRGSYCYPLYLYGDDGLLKAKSDAPTPNIREAILSRLSKHLKLTFISKGRGDLTSSFGPEDVLNFVYASLYSHAYRERYSTLIKNGFPRLPLTGSVELFRALTRLGGELVALHILESPKLDTPSTEFIGDRTPKVEKISWSKNAVWLDKAQTSGFKNVLEAVWNFHIGGYQVCEKWLKDRKGRTLSKDDIVHYQKIVVALAETIRLMKEIDEVIEAHGGWPGAFSAKTKKKKSEVFV